MKTQLFMSDKDESFYFIDETVNLSQSKDDTSQLEQRRNAALNLHRLILSSTTVATLCVSVASNDFLNQEKIRVLGSPYYTFDSSVNSVMRNDVQLIDRFYDCLNIESINRFLNANASLVPDLVKCQIEISKKFGNVFPTMELVVDSEFPDWETIFITIPIKLNFKSSYAALNLFFKEWMVNQTVNFRRKVTVRLQ